MAAAAAEATPPDSTSDDETLLHCSVCQENFHPKSRLPRSLPCHHSFCGDCIDKLEQDSQVKCPMCRKVAKVEGPFPVDDTLTAYLELRLPAQAEEAPPCEDCPDKEKATVRCQDCSANFCDACSKAHKRVKIARNHAMIELTEIAQNPELLKLAPEKCGIHKGRPFEFFCKTCDKPVCAACAAMLHRDGHDIADLEDEMKIWKQKVILECEEFSETIEGLEVKAASLKTILEHMDTDHNHAIEDIEKTFVELQTALNVKKAALLSDLGAKVKANRLALEEELATVESQISSSKATRDYSQRLVQYGLPSQFVAHLAELKNPAVIQEAKQVMEALTDARPIGFDRKGLQQIKTAVETFGAIFDGAITCTLEDVENLTETGTCSDAGYFCDGKWSIEAKTTGSPSSRNLALCWDCSIANTKPWAYTVHFQLKVLSLTGKHKTRYASRPHIFNAGTRSSGWDPFMTTRALPVVDQFANMSLVEQTENPLVREFRQALDMMSSQQSPVIDSYIQQMFSDLESNINDAESYYQLIEILYTQCVYCPNFHYTGAKVLLYFCPPNVSNPFFISFLQSFMERIDLDFCRREELAHDPELMGLLCGLAFFLGELFVCLITDGKRDPVVTQSLPLKLIQMMLTLLGNPTQHTVKTAAQLCKLVGGHLQDSVQNDPRMQSQLEELFNIFRALLNTSSLSEICALVITSLLKAKDNNWGRNEYYPPSTSSGNTSYGMEATDPAMGFVKDGTVCIEGSFKLDLSKGMLGC